MKQFLFGLIATVSFMTSAFAQDFETSVAMIRQPRVATNVQAGKSARTFLAMNFDSRYTLLSSYTVNSIDFTDDGHGYDVKANDGVYTSSQLTANPKTPFNPNEWAVALSDNFTHNADLQASASKIKVGVKLTGCKVKYTNSGVSSISGIPCSKLGGCISITGCTVEFSFEFEW